MPSFSLHGCNDHFCTLVLMHRTQDSEVSICYFSTFKIQNFSAATTRTICPRLIAVASFWLFQVCLRRHINIPQTSLLFYKATSPRAQQAGSAQSLSFGSHSHHGKQLPWSWHFQGETHQASKEARAQWDFPLCTLYQPRSGEGRSDPTAEGRRDRARSHSHHCQPSSWIQLLWEPAPRKQNADPKTGSAQ